MKSPTKGLLLATLIAAGCAVSPVMQTSAPIPHGAAPGALRAIAGEVSEAGLRGYVETMVGFGTRHTLSDTTSPSRGIGAARRWVETEFKAMAAKCGGCLEVVLPSDVVTGPRIPNPTEVVDVVAIQRGMSDPNRVIIIQGHLDSRVNDVMDATTDAPGANDDASGVAAVMETARILSGRRFPATLVYAALSGEEQGLVGGRILAEYAKTQGWEVLAVLNNDIVGNTHGLAGIVEDRVRVFSEGVRSAETEAQGNARRSVGGEVDSPSRNLARYIDVLADQYLPGLDTAMVYRRDRFGRGGDQVPMVEAGFPAVRITEAAENYTRQHQDIRSENGIVYGDTIDGVDVAYLARVTRLNAITLASLASAPRPPLEIKVEGAVSANTKVTWTASPGAASYIVWWRDTTSPTWQHNQLVNAGETSVLLDRVVIDDWFFGVQAISADGYGSPIQFAGVVGEFISASTN